MRYLTGTFPLEAGLISGTNLQALKDSVAAWFDPRLAVTLPSGGFDRVESIANVTGNTDYSLAKQVDGQRPALIADGPGGFPGILHDDVRNDVLKLVLSGGATWAPGDIWSAALVCRMPYATATQSAFGWFKDASNYTYVSINSTQSIARLRMGPEDVPLGLGGEVWTRMRRGTADADMQVLWFGFNGNEIGYAATNDGPISQSTFAHPSQNGVTGQASPAPFIVGGHTLSGSGSGNLVWRNLLFFPPGENVLDDPDNATRIMWLDYFRHVERIPGLI